ncbi:cytochrome P460 [Granulicella sp. 5B5]|uniref:heme-binding domain-containing protein n=1 Tax=Granulicella sp. 5B5 TaxID=1617967 RepID=UPI0015F357A9|nr:cytochrome P460 family protein [Granulicella sp. 5B5]QMV18972.1 cytochrome P460 [Granulicella sp. 5B5]
MRAPRWIVVLGVVFVLGVAMQAVRPSLGKPAGSQAEIAAPPEVRAILQRRCYACHSDAPQLAWFDQVEPAYWMVAKDVREARAHLNFSELGTKPVAAQRAELFEAVNMIQLGAMPLPQYLAVHREAGVTPEELAVLKTWLAPFAPVAASAAAPVSVPSFGERKGAASLSLNGVPYFPDYRDWKVISTTDRGDNHTMRIITGNDVAIRAAEQRKISPWPDGSVFAKITMASSDDGQGHVSAGKFVQVEFMVKDAQKYAATQGWGYARYKGDALKPYGADAHFDRECTGCHAPMRDNDFVYSMPIAREVGR